MVSLRREVKSNDDVYGGYRVRFGANQNTYGFNPDNDNYDNYRTQYGDSVALNQGRERFYPSDRRNEKSARMSGKGKFLIVLYVIIVAIFIALVVANSTVITTAKESDEQNQTLSEQEKNYTTAGRNITVDAENVELYSLTRMQNDTNGTEEDSYDLIEEIVPDTHKTSSNWFDKLCEIFG